MFEAGEVSSQNKRIAGIAKYRDLLREDGRKRFKDYHPTERVSP